MAVDGILLVSWAQVDISRGDRAKTQSADDGRLNPH